MADAESQSGSGEARPRIAWRERVPILLIASVLVPSLLLGLLVVSATRNYLIEARTLGATIAFRGETNAWELDSAIVCRRRIPPDLEQGVDGICPLAFFEVSEPTPLILDWSDGDRIELALDREGYLELTKLAGQGQNLGIGDRALVPPSIWVEHGALMVRGAVILGSDMGSGADDYLIDGQWEARQRTFVPAIGSTSLAAVKSGTFSRGTAVEVFGNHGPAMMFGHFTPSLSDDDQGFVTTLVSEAGRVDLRLRYYGRADYVVLRPSIIDTVVASPILLAASIILSLLASAKDLMGLKSGGGLHRIIKRLVRRKNS